MASFAETQVDSIRTRISEIESGVFVVRDVPVEQDDDPQGEATRVTIALTAAEVSEGERVDAFVAFGRAARRIAFEVLGDDQTVRVAYRVATGGQAPSQATRGSLGWPSEG